MATYVVNTTTDERDGNIFDGDVSLRDAIEVANNNPGRDTIRFNGALDGQTLNLTLGEIAIEDDLTIIGFGNRLTLSGNDDSGIFIVDDGDGIADVDVTIRQLRMVDGHAFDGGAIFNTENLTLENSTVENSFARNNGGAVASTGNLIINNSNLNRHLRNIFFAVCYVV